MLTAESCRRVAPRAALRAALLASLLLAGCGSAPKAVEPQLRKQALDTEADGVRRHARGDYAGAARHFAAAAQLRQSLDDPAAVARNQLNQARAELALGQADAALDRALRISHPEAALESLLVQAQASLALARPDHAQARLAAAAALCAASCSRHPSLRLLQARTALAEGNAQDALKHAEAALALLQDKDEANETGNAWRLIAAARLASGDAGGALPAARAALDIDRQLALPEKIARDWLLIGDIQRKLGAGDTAPSYRRALDVAAAAGLADIARLATQALAEITITKESAK